MRIATSSEGDADRQEETWRFRSKPARPSAGEGSLDDLGPFSHPALPISELRVRPETLLPMSLITGEVQDPATPVKRFQAGGVPVFLISLNGFGF
jgi:hypothetical protein